MKPMDENQLTNTMSYISKLQSCSPCSIQVVMFMLRHWNDKVEQLNRLLNTLFDTSLTIIDDYPVNTQWYDSIQYQVLRNVFPVS